jgi:penicillin-binding protein 1A
MENMPPYLPMALGAGESTLLKMTLAYAMFVNGGMKLNATLIDRIQDHLGRTVFKHDRRPCDGCRHDVWANQPVPRLPDDRERVLDPATAYQIVSMLRGVILRGTGGKIRRVGKPLAGKTGTSNESKDTWFIGFSPNLALGVYVGFDNPRSLGRREQGASAAAPIFRDFFIDILRDKPPTPFRVPKEIRLIKVNVKTGQKATRGKGVIWEAFKKGNGPDSNRNLLGVRMTQEKDEPGAVARPKTGSGGRY